MLGLPRIVGALAASAEGCAMHDSIQAFRTAILATLGHAPAVIEPGKLHRFATSDKRSDDAGWCKLFDDLHGGACSVVIGKASARHGARPAARR